MQKLGLVASIDSVCKDCASRRLNMHVTSKPTVSREAIAQSKAVALRSTPYDGIIDSACFQSSGFVVLLRRPAQITRPPAELNACSSEEAKLCVGSGYDIYRGAVFAEIDATAAEKFFLEIYAIDVAGKCILDAFDVGQSFQASDN